MSGIRPTTGAWFNLAFLILTGVAAGSVNFAGIQESTAHIIQAWAANGAFFISCANLVFNLYSAKEAGPLNK